MVVMLHMLVLLSGLSYLRDVATSCIGHRRTIGRARSTLSRSGDPRRSTNASPSERNFYPNSNLNLSDCFFKISISNFRYSIPNSNATCMVRHARFTARSLMPPKVFDANYSHTTDHYYDRQHPRGSCLVSLCARGHRPQYGAAPQYPTRARTRAPYQRGCGRTFCVVIRRLVVFSS